MAEETIHTSAAYPTPCGGDAMTAFMTLVLDDEALQARLGEIELPDLYVSEALRIASAHDIALDGDQVRSAIQPDPLGIGRWMASPVTLDRWPARGWLPSRVSPTDGAPALDWAWFGAHRLDEPFYEESVRRFATRPFSLMFRTRTSMDTLLNGMGPASVRVPDGFIHHMSRCGSTLVARMLAADPSNVVLSEPGPFDDVLRWAIESDAPTSVRIAALRAIVAALGRDRTGTSRRLFVKLDSWHTMALPLLREAFPDTPWTYLYRKPVEVLVSQMRERGSNAVAGLLPTSILDIPGGEAMEAESYVALVLAKFSTAVLDNWLLGGGLLVNYDELPSATIDRIAPHFGMALDAKQVGAMLESTLRHSKAPDRPFVSDGAQKRDDATNAVKTVARDLLEPIHARLDQLRRQ